MRLDAATVAQIASAIDKDSIAEKIMARIGDFWNTVQGLDSLTNLTSVAEGCSYNLHPFTVTAQRKSDPPSAAQAPNGSGSETLRPEGTQGDSGALRPSGTPGGNQERAETDPIPVASPTTPPSTTPGVSGGGGAAESTDGSGTSRPRIPSHEEHNLLTVRVVRRSIEAEAVFQLNSYILGETAACSIQLAQLVGFDWKLFNQVSVEFDHTEVPTGTLLWMKGLFNPYGLGYAHFFGTFHIALDRSPATIKVAASRLTLAGDLNSITENAQRDGVLLESRSAVAYTGRQSSDTNESE